MKRLVLDKLEKWKQVRKRKPLVLRGARQVGKTWVLKAFGETFKDGYIHINFDKQPEYHQFFKTTKDVKRILQNISILENKKITTDTLIIFDEIQACPDALNSLKYFNEDASDFFLACAGSLLGLTLAEGFPVGQVQFLNIYPMSFEEFLIADGYENLYEYISDFEKIENIPDAFNDILTEKLKQYFVVGGMPEVVDSWTQEGDIRNVDVLQADILTSYEHDFGKHAPATDVPKIGLIWNSLPSQLARENKKFLYSVVKNGARAREYENALNWIKNADLVKKVPRITKPGLPLSAYEDLNAFKIYMNDVGLLRRHAKLAASAFGEDIRLFTEFKGALTENYVLSALLGHFAGMPYYWSETPHEVDFIIQKENDIYPIEVKAGRNIKAASIRKYKEKYGDNTKKIIRFSLNNLSLDGDILNAPLYMADELERLIELV